MVLYEYLGEEYPEVLGSILGALKGIVNVIGMTRMTPPIKDLLPRLTPILKNRHEKARAPCMRAWSCSVLLMCMCTSHATLEEVRAAEGCASAPDSALRSSLCTSHAFLVGAWSWVWLVWLIASVYRRMHVLGGWLLMMAVGAGKLGFRVQKNYIFWRAGSLLVAPCSGRARPVLPRSWGFTCRG